MFRLARSRLHPIYTGLVELSEQDAFQRSGTIFGHQVAAGLENLTYWKPVDLNKTMVHHWTKAGDRWKPPAGASTGAQLNAVATEALNAFLNGHKRKQLSAAATKFDGLQNLEADFSFVENGGGPSRASEIDHWIRHVATHHCRIDPVAPTTSSGPNFESVTDGPCLSSALVDVNVAAIVGEITLDGRDVGYKLYQLEKDLQVMKTAGPMPSHIMLAVCVNGNLQDAQTALVAADAMLKRLRAQPTPPLVATMAVHFLFTPCRNVFKALDALQKETAENRASFIKLSREVDDLRASHISSQQSRQQQQAWEQQRQEDHHLLQLFVAVGAICIVAAVYHFSLR